ncbi:MAG: DCC1-like thiol-disulfide oxidoreductase family protein [Cypionkella sp.]|nr:DCC1-like thiol-disulfide oxidoreductase family protein [Cypionkella sp.]
MKDTASLRILFNDTCPICAREMGIYARDARRAGAQMQFCPLDSFDSFGLDADTAARRLHVLQGGQLLVGIDAFIAIWAALPRWAWAARAARWPVIYPTLCAAYNYILAPIIYRLHVRRQKKARGKRT